jgi:hypothetical protein
MRNAMNALIKYVDPMFQNEVHVSIRIIYVIVRDIPKFPLTLLARNISPVIPLSYNGKFCSI